MTIKEHREQKALEKAVSKIHKILQDKNISSVENANGYTLVTFTNGQVFKMK